MVDSGKRTGLGTLLYFSPNLLMQLILATLIVIFTSNVGGKNVLGRSSKIARDASPRGLDPKNGGLTWSNPLQEAPSPAYVSVVFEAGIEEFKRMHKN